MTPAPLFRNPLAGIIHPYGWIRPAGNTDFRVTKTSAQHVASGGPPAIDLGDGNIDADAITAVIGGRVFRLLIVGSANVEIDYTDPSGQVWRIVYAHDRLPHPITAGQTITTGQIVGHVGSTGASLAHLHLQIGMVNGSIVWLDPWPLLAQNRPEETEMTIIPATGFAALVNKATAIRAGTNYRSAPTLGAATVLGTTSVQTEWHPFASCQGDEANGSSTWYAGELLVPGLGHTIVFVHGSRVVSPFTPAETIPDPTTIARLADKQTALISIAAEAHDGIAI